VNPRTAAEWIEAHQHCARRPDVPRILAKEAAKHYAVALRKARPAKPAIRLPRGSRRVSSLKALKRKAWAAFSKWIRQRDAGENGFAKCCTCEEVRHWKGMDAGHFESRVKESTLFDEQNVHAQCKGCNMPPNNGRRIEYARFLDETYGPGTASALTARARRQEQTREDLEKILAKYSAAEPPAASAVPPLTPPLNPPSPSTPGAAT
jgi:hypothetical protein